MAIIRAAFVHLLGIIDDRELTYVSIEEADRMAILHPNTSAIPIWRRQPTRLEHPISAWRCWGIQKEQGDWVLSSVAADCFWEGPVIRAHKRPVDPKYWDAKKKPEIGDARDYYEEMHDTFSIAGIHALKTKEQAIDAAGMYSVSCYGEVHLWGRIAQFELGYRAEVCMVKRLFLFRHVEVMFNGRNDARDYDVIDAKTQDLVDSLSRRYECEVTIDG